MHHHPSLVVLCAHHLHVLGVVVCSVLFNQVARVALGSLSRWDSLSLSLHSPRSFHWIVVDGLVSLTSLCSLVPVDCLAWSSLCWPHLVGSLFGLLYLDSLVPLRWLVPHRSYHWMALLAARRPEARQPC